MRSGQRKALRRLCALVFAIAMSSAGRAAATPRVVCIDEGNAELRARITGQTRDLAVDVRWVEVTLPHPPDVASLHAVTIRNAANWLVVVQRPAQGGLRVYVYEAAQRSLRERLVPAPRAGERLATSTAAETAALIVRGELVAALSAVAGPRERSGSSPTPESNERPEEGAAGRANAAGPSASGHSGPSGAAGVATTQRERTASAATRDAVPATGSTPVRRSKPDEPDESDQPEWDEADKSDEPDESDEPDDPDQPDEPSRPLSAEPRLSLALGARTTLPGMAQPFLGPELALRFAVFYVELSLVAATSFSQTLERDAAAIRLRRHEFALEALAWLRVHPALELGVGAAGSFVLYARETRPRAGFEATRDSTLTSAALGPLLQLRWEFAHNVGASLRGGVNFVQSPIRFAVMRAGDSSRENLLALPFYEVWAAVALFADIWE